MAAHDEHDHHRGLAFDLRTLSRRRALTLLGGGTLAVLAACGANRDDATDAAGSTTQPPATGSQSTTGGASGEGCETIAEETAGPFPANGSNGPDVLTESGVVRSDIRSSFGPYRGTAGGVPLTINLALLDTTANCQASAGKAVYVWHCDQSAGYSLYSEGVEDQNYLRGVQESDGTGRVSFTSIFPAAYSGRWPHIHFEVYESLQAATGGGTPVVTSQVALPKEICDQVYATEGYEQSVRTMARTTLRSDGVFGDDDGRSQLATASGDVAGGYTVELSVPVGG